MHKTKSCGIWELLWRIPEGFLILKTFRGCTGVLWFANISQFWRSFAPPTRLSKSNILLGCFKLSNIHVLQDLVGFFLFKNMFCWDSLIWTYLLLSWKNNGKNMNYVHLSQNLHILCAFKSKLSHTLCTIKPKFAHTLCANKPCLY